MLTNVNPKLPMRNKAATKDYYINKLGFRNVGNSDYDGYLMVEKDNIEIHFFEFKEIESKENYSGIYIRTNNIDNLYQNLILLKNKFIWSYINFSLITLNFCT